MLRTRLDVRHLRFMLAIEETGSVTRAAELLGLTQPALSRQIREAERCLGVALYSRENKRMHLTPAGDCLLQSAKRLLRDLSRAETDVMDFPSQPRETVRLGIDAYPWHFWLPRFLKDTGLLGEIDVDIVTYGDLRPVEALQQKVLDVAIVAGPLDGRGVHYAGLFDDELVAVFSSDHPLAGKPVVQAEDFAEQDFITYGPTYQKGYETDRVLRPANVWPRKLLKMNQTEGIVAMVAAGFGISVLSRWAVATHARTGKLALSRITEGGLPITWSAVYRPGSAETSAQSLADALSSWCAGSPASFEHRE